MSHLLIPGGGTWQATQVVYYSQDQKLENGQKNPYYIKKQKYSLTKLDGTTQEVDVLVFHLDTTQGISDTGMGTEDCPFRNFRRAMAFMSNCCVSLPCMYFKLQCKGSSNAADHYTQVRSCEIEFNHRLIIEGLTLSSAVYYDLKDVYVCNSTLTNIHPYLDCSETRYINTTLDSGKGSYCASSIAPPALNNGGTYNCTINVAQGGSDCAWDDDYTPDRVFEGQTRKAVFTAVFGGEHKLTKVNYSIYAFLTDYGRLTWPDGCWDSCGTCLTVTATIAGFSAGCQVSECTVTFDKHIQWDEGNWFNRVQDCKPDPDKDDVKNIVRLVGKLQEKTLAASSDYP